MSLIIKMEAKYYITKKKIEIKFSQKKKIKGLMNWKFWQGKKAFIESKELINPDNSKKSEKFFEHGSVIWEKFDNLADVAGKVHVGSFSIDTHNKKAELIIEKEIAEKCDGCFLLVITENGVWHDLGEIDLKKAKEEGEKKRKEGEEEDKKEEEEDKKEGEGEGEQLELFNGEGEGKGDDEQLELFNGEGEDKKEGERESKPPLSEEEEISLIAKIVELNIQGLRNFEIAKELGITDSQVSYYLKRVGQPANISEKPKEKPTEPVKEEDAKPKEKPTEPVKEEDAKPKEKPTEGDWDCDERGYTIDSPGIYNIVNGDNYNITIIANNVKIMGGKLRSIKVKSNNVEITGNTKLGTKEATFLDLGGYPSLTVYGSTIVSGGIISTAQGISVSNGEAISVGKGGSVMILKEANIIGKIGSEEKDPTAVRGGLYIPPLNWDRKSMFSNYIWERVSKDGESKSEDKKGEETASAAEPTGEGLENFPQKAIDEAQQLVDMLNNNQDARRALEFTAGISPDETLKKEDILKMDKKHFSSAIKAAEKKDIEISDEAIKLLKDLEKYLKK